MNVLRINSVDISLLREKNGFQDVNLSHYKQKPTNLQRKYGKARGWREISHSGRKKLRSFRVTFRAIKEVDLTPDKAGEEPLKTISVLNRPMTKSCCTNLANLDSCSIAPCS